MKELSITDFRLAGFLVSRGVSLLRTSKNGKGEVVFTFDDSEGFATKTLMSFPNSPEQRYDSACKTMYDLVKIELRK